MYIVVALSTHPQHPLPFPIHIDREWQGQQVEHQRSREPYVVQQVIIQFQQSFQFTVVFPVADHALCCCHQAKGLAGLGLAEDVVSHFHLQLYLLYLFQTSQIPLVFAVIVA
jgi:hypothetical protein